LILTLINYILSYFPRYRNSNNNCSRKLLTAQRGLGTHPWRLEYSWSAWNATCSCICRDFFVQSQSTNFGQASASFIDFCSNAQTLTQWFTDLLCTDLDKTWSKPKGQRF